MTTNTQAYSLPILYKNNLQVAWGSATTLTVAGGQARDGSNSFDITTGLTTINAAVNGLNGLDTGSLADSTWYALLQIGSSLNLAQPGFLLTQLANVATPVMPNNYDISDVLAYWVTDSSGNLLKGYVVGNGNFRRHYHDTSIAILSAGTSQTLATIGSLLPAVPPIDNTPVLITATYTPNTIGDKVSFAPGGSTATVLPFVAGSVAAHANSDNFTVLSKLISASPTILYINSAASGATSVWADGFEYFV